MLKLDQLIITNRMRWAAEVEGAEPRTTRDHFGVAADGDFSGVPEDKMELGINTRVHIPLDCSVDPTKFHCLVAPNPKLFEVAEVSCVGLIVPDFGRVRPVVTLRGLKKFDLSSLDWVATIHMM